MKTDTLVESIRLEVANFRSNMKLSADLAERLGIHCDGAQGIVKARKGKARMHTVGDEVDISPADEKEFGRLNRLTAFGREASARHIALGAIEQRLTMMAGLVAENEALKKQVAELKGKGKGKGEVKIPARDTGAAVLA